ncbi:MULTISPECIES: GUN4 domain-containing protein [unclassified Nostoc]|uniref:GUN4 domain-containing protein n=1 Tax=unclassified Nostoc TaxID=2593658 RepID=UPI0026024E68|nr:GUN4 domain-containing protein [Nostoc sp. S13]MDF5737829.1 GUN4 domain-containing protein [Nostoc sp. S13]
MPEVSLQLFFSYSHKDEALRDELANHLSTLIRQGVISSWHDRKILPGEEWDHQINDNLNTADIILLLVSSDFICSNYCWEVEVTTAIKRHNTGKALVIPVILRRVDWSDTPFAKLQFLPKNAEPVTSWTNRDEAFTNVAQGIRAAAQQLKVERQQKLALARKEAAIAEYHQKVEEFAADGEISFVESEILKDLQERLGLTDEEARTVRDKVLEPYGKYKENLDKYKQIFTKLVDEQGYPLGEKAKADLKKLQQHLKLKDEDIVLIDNEAEVQKQQAEILHQQQREQAEAEKLRQQQANRLQQQQEQAEAEKLRQQQAQRLKLQREQEEAERLGQEQQSTGNDLLSEKGVDYTRLRDLLRDSEWKEADQETLAVMLKATGREKEGWLDIDSSKNFPCTDLRTIDQLWVKYSNGRFGFSVQKRIWESVGKDYEKFGDRVGWVKWRTVVVDKWFGLKQQTEKQIEWLRYYSDLTFDTSASEGHLPAAGVNFLDVESVDVRAKHPASYHPVFNEDNVRRYYKQGGLLWGREYLFSRRDL